MENDRQYLEKYYLHHSQLALKCQVDETLILNMIDSKLIPRPSYTVLADTSIDSCVFGRLPVSCAQPGNYFPPSMQVWIVRALETIDRVGLLAAYEELKCRFKHQFNHALSELNQTMWRMEDSFDDEGLDISVGLEKRSSSAWEYFLNGTFGLCVSQAVSEKAIARKEVLQEKLQVLSQGPMPSKEELPYWIEWIAEYAQISMPFSPSEYMRSSRKRIVEDLYARCQGG